MITVTSAITSGKGIFCARKVAAEQSSSHMPFGQRSTTKPIKLPLTVRTGPRRGKTARSTYSLTTLPASREETTVSGSVGVRPLYGLVVLSCLLLSKLSLRHELLAKHLMHIPHKTKTLLGDCWILPAFWDTFAL